MNTNSRFYSIVLAAMTCLFCISICEGAVIYVDADAGALHDGLSWDTAFHKLNDALAVAVSGDEIRVAEGVYRPDETSADPNGTGDRSAAFNLIDGVILQGGYAGLGAADPNERDINGYKTILSGDLDNNDTEVSNASSLLGDLNRAENSYHVVSADNSSAATVLDGFIVSGNIANGADPHFNGGGILIVSANPTISNCRFEYNAAANGGAIYITTASSPTITDCFFLRNYAQDAGGAVRCTQSSSPVLSGCNFIENKAAGFGGAIANYNNSSPTLLECSFSYNWSKQGGAVNNYDFCSPGIIRSTFRYNATDNTGGAIRNENHSDPILINCGFYSNIGAHGAGLYNYQSNPVMINCIASGNIAVEYGGVIYNRDSIDGGITNCTFVGNTAYLRGAVLYNILSNPTIQNSILWGNTDPNSTPIVTESGSPAVNYSCIQGGWPAGTGNIDDNPMFIDPNGADGVIGTTDDDFRLFAPSPCIDAGDNTAVPADILDLDNDANVLERVSLDFAGNARFVDIPDAADMGIPDLPGYPDIVDMGAVERAKPIFVDSQAPGIEQDGTAWEKAYNHLQDALAIAEKGDVIWVAQGIYYPDRDLANPAGTGDRTAAFELVDGVVLQGGYAGWTQADPDLRDSAAYPTILSGDLPGNDAAVSDPVQMQTDPNRADNSYHVIVASGTGDYTELSGFTVQSGHANGASGMPNSFGAAMYTTDAVIQLSNCSFQWNWSITGGALYNYGSSLTFSGCSFSQNVAEDKGGVMRNTIYCSSVFTDCTFTDNSAGSFGGVISNNDHSSSTMTRCVFSNNTASSAGAVNNFTECNSSFTDCEFTLNQVISYGGAVNNYQQSNSQFVRCGFSGNSASLGGAIYNDNSAPSVTDCSFSENITTNSGGAIFSTGSPLSIQKSTFTANQSGNFGGALYNVALSAIDATDCVFASNTAIRGGAVFAENSPLTLSGCHFLENASTTDSGGAVYNGSAGLSLTKSIFRGNASGVNGGAVCDVVGQYLDLKDCLFSANTALYDGGALYIENITDVDMTNCLMTYNDAEYGGGIANTGSGTTDIVHCTLNQNTASIGHGIYNSGTAATIQNSIVYDYIIPSSSVTVTYSCALNGLGAGTGNTNLDPLFVNPLGPDGVAGTEDDNFRLTSNSPCIDAGDNSLIPSGVETDLDGLSRIVNGDCNGIATADMGAYEFSYLSMGDFDQSCSIDLLDYVELAKTWLMLEDDSGYNAKCDISLPKDNVIDAADLKVLSENWLFGK